ncbi:hypothetical protein DDB_G0288397 [Dictyostelium discoideum AX4]|uniref:Uncharacterized protein n=1 Tax=Dictyostelium discoideum TaxID=44689 RepID=Q54J02_DICDI|nr:hypothetical protein DDB_G0288397 [Dictyostelium discoideum AX4]EAL63224.1 hypothetical protein DDB_G0288397 [Dictyostelium discoideum AX4]|eukprot:XP_636728.1 hypothetical protein DDB_G0288397 [Dictyostelium discoideum AX4]
MGNTHSNVDEEVMDSANFKAAKDALKPKSVRFKVDKELDDEFDPRPVKRVDRNLDDNLVQKPVEGLVWPHIDNSREFDPEVDEHYLLG